MSAGDAPNTPHAANTRATAGTPDQALASRDWRDWRTWTPRLLDRYPTLGPPLEGTGARVAFWFVLACAAAYTIFFAVYLFALQDAWQTHAEDMGIMTQALWNTTHGALLHQTVCNIVSDSNCLGDVSRFAIHFEPIMLPVALLYAVVPSPKTLQLLQVAMVASGALPAYWLASRRLRSALAGIVFALLYLAYPPLQAAITDDFHAVTLAAAFLMFALYFMLSRNDRGLIIACVLAMATKEEVPLDVIMIGASIALLQRRWRVGGALAGLAVVWLVVALLVMRAASPLGHSPTAARYAQFGASPLQVAATLLTHPVQVLRDYVLSASGVTYLRALLGGVGYLAILSPWSLAVAAPAIAINLLSSDPTMRSGGFQYNAEIAPFIIFAALDAVWWLSRGAGWLAPRLVPRLARYTASATQVWAEPLARAARWDWPRLAMAGLTLFAAAFGAYGLRQHSQTPLNPAFTWPEASARLSVASRILGMIPATASVSAQSDLVPQLSDRRFVYLYPYKMREADYVFLDVAGSIYPQLDRDAYARQAQDLLRDPGYHVIAASDGYVLLQRGPGPALDPSDPYGLPPSFYTFATHAGTPGHALDARFGPSLELIGYVITPGATIYPQNPFLEVVTYWRVGAPLAGPAFAEISLTAPDGARVASSASPAAEWLPMARWRPGTVYEVDSGPIYVASATKGLNQVGVRVLAGAPGDPLGPLAPTLAPGAGGAVAVMDGGTRLVIGRVMVR